MTVRAKFICRGKQQDPSTPEQGNVVLEAVIDGSQENKEFFSMTPWGQVNLGILNPDAYAQFEPGKEYYVDFSPVTSE